MLAFAAAVTDLKSSAFRRTWIVCAFAWPFGSTGRPTFLAFFGIFPMLLNDCGLLFGTHNVCHICTLYGNNCTTVIRACQEVFLCYSIYMLLPPQFEFFARLVLREIKEIKEGIKKQAEAADAANERDLQQNLSRPSQSVTVDFSDSVRASKKASETDEKNQHQRLIFWTRLTFFAVVAYTTIAAYQSWQMRIQTRQIFRQSEVENADASHRALQAYWQLRTSQRAIEASQHALVIQERAWIAPGRPGILPTGPIAPNKSFEITVPISNVGKTPAYILSSVLQIDVISGELPASPVYKDMREQIASRNVLYPGAPGPIMPVSYTLTQTQFDQIRAGKFFLKIHGRITYLDTIENKQHLTTYCYFYGSTSTNSLGSCREYQHAD
ncbi:MAG: hypothetical protein HY046_09095 [Acidobacteria bacterium]|nr:hypothetical protein [Acidobacteriota bacterium]